MIKRILVIGFLLLSLLALGSFVSIAPGGKYFEHNGKILIPLGFNDGIIWPSLSPTLLGNREAADRYFKKLKSYGVNTLRIMFEYAEDRNNLSLFEDPLGVQNEIVIEAWDMIFELAEKYNIYIIITPWDPYWMHKNWDVNPYNKANGGPIDTLSEFLTNETVIKNAKERYAFMIDRYGSSEQLLAWELNNEIELWYGKLWGKSDRKIVKETKKWVKEMATYIKTHEIEKYGQTHLLTISTAFPAPTSLDFFKLYDIQDLDFFTTHFYLGSVKNPSDPLLIAEGVSEIIKYHNYVFNNSKPFMDSESGPIDNWPQDVADDITAYRTFSWTHLASGGTGIGMRWPYVIPHKMPAYLLSVIRAISKFIDSSGIDWLNFSGVNMDDRIISKKPTDLFITACGNTEKEPQESIGYGLMPGNKNIGDFSIELSGLCEGHYIFELWDTESGETITSGYLKSDDGTLILSGKINRPEFAFKIYKRGE